MTRINVVAPSSLCDQHLIAETRELTRIPNAVIKAVANGKLNAFVSVPLDYVLGTGHVRFFYSRLGFLESRHALLLSECKKRGINFKDIFPHVAVHNLPISLRGDYTPTAHAIAINRLRITQNMPAKPRFSQIK